MSDDAKRKTFIFLLLTAGCMVLIAVGLAPPRSQTRHSASQMGRRHAAVSERERAERDDLFEHVSQSAAGSRRHHRRALLHLQIPQGRSLERNSWPGSAHCVAGVAGHRHPVCFCQFTHHARDASGRRPSAGTSPGRRTATRFSACHFNLAGLDWPGDAAARCWEFGSVNDETRIGVQVIQ